MSDKFNTNKLNRSFLSSRGFFARKFSNRINKKKIKFSKNKKKTKNKWPAL